VDGGAFDGREKFVSGGVGERPAEGDAAERRVDEYGAVAVVPGEAKESGLSGDVLCGDFGKVADGGLRAGGDGLEDVADRGKASFDADLVGIHGTGDNAADAGDEGLLVGDADDAGRRADDVDDVAEADV